MPYAFRVLHIYVLLSLCTVNSLTSFRSSVNFFCYFFIVDYRMNAKLNYM